MEAGAGAAAGGGAAVVHMDCRSRALAARGRCCVVRRTGEVLVSVPGTTTGVNSRSSRRSYGAIIDGGVSDGVADY